MRLRVSIVLILASFANMGLVAAESNEIDLVLDDSQFPIIEVKLKDGAKKRVKLDGIAAITDESFKLNIRELLSHDHAFLAAQSPGKTPSVVVNMPFWKVRPGDFTFAMQLWGTCQINIFLVEQGWAKPEAPLLKWSSEELEQVQKLGECIKDVSRQIEILRSNDSLLEDRLKALESLRLVRMNARSATPLIAEIIKSGDGNLREQALLTLGHIGSDNPENISILLPFLRDFPQSVLLALLQFDAHVRIAEPTLIEYLRDTPNHRVNHTLALQVLEHCGTLHAPSLRELRTMSEDPNRRGSFRGRLQIFLENYKEAKEPKN
jgi:hypothetical protein